LESDSEHDLMLDLQSVVNSSNSEESNWESDDESSLDFGSTSPDNKCTCNVGQRTGCYEVSRKMFQIGLKSL
jgi:hypothetical protein